MNVHYNFRLTNKPTNASLKKTKWFIEMVSDDDYNEKRWRELFKIFNNIMNNILHDLENEDNINVYNVYGTVNDIYNRGERDEDNNIEIDDYGDEVYIIIDLSWLNPKEIKIRNLDKNRIYLEAYSGYGIYRKVIDVPLNMDIKSRELKYKNGLVKIVFTKK